MLWCWPKLIRNCWKSQEPSSATTKINRWESLSSSSPPTFANCSRCWGRTQHHIQRHHHHHHHHRQHHQHYHYLRHYHQHSPAARSVGGGRHRGGGGRLLPGEELTLLTVNTCMTLLALNLQQLFFSTARCSSSHNSLRGIHLTIQSSPHFGGGATSSFDGIF